ncbi:hypothetical protein IAD21_04162 [Abditibacteriota bacterium]|nr:hypothetical protein IAD21_04162 [Abditibacteriota bacterium]
MKRRTLRRSLPALLTTLLAFALPVALTPAHADIQDRLYDFTDAYYLSNGINPAMISGRRQATPPLGTTDTPFFSYQRPVRALLTLPAYDQSGNPWFFTVLGGFSVAAFTPNSAGQKARQIAESNLEYIFPQRGTDPMGLGALRQSVVLDMRHGYFGNDPLGLWLHTWVSYTDQAFNTKDGQKALSDLTKKNGLAVDGTPIIKSVSDIENLQKKGFITTLNAPLNSELRYAICPVNRDPRNGGIAPDQFLATTLKPDGTPLEPAFTNLFNSLKASKPSSSSSGGKS